MARRRPLPCQPRSDVTHQVGSLCETHHTLGFPTTFLLFVPCVPRVLKIDRALPAVFCRAVFLLFATCLEEVDRVLRTVFCRTVFLSIFTTRYAIISSHKSTTSSLRGAGIERSCPTGNLVIFARHIVGFYSQLPLYVASSLLRCVTCRRSARIRCGATSSTTSSSC